MEINKLSDTIEKFKIDKTMLAKQMGLSQSSFSKKISVNVAYTHSFTEEEKNKLLKILVSVGKELCKLGDK